MGISLPRRVTVQGSRRREISLPQYLITNYGEEEYGLFEDKDDWSVTLGSVDNDIVNYRHGTQSIKLTSGIGGSGNIYRSLPGWNLLNKRIRLIVYSHNPGTDYASNSMRVYISSTTFSTTNFQYIIRHDRLSVQEGWNIYDLYPDGWIAQGDENWNNSMIGIQLRITPNEGVQVSVSFDAIVLGIENIPCALLSVDDAPISTYTEAMPYLQARRMRATQYLYTNAVGTAETLTVEQVQAIYDAGWDIGNHTRTHTNLTTLTQPEIEAELLNGKSDIESWGFAGAADHVAYPYGAANATVFAGMANAGMLSGRTISQYRMATIECAEYDYWVGSQNLDGQTLEDAKEFIDKLLLYKRVVSFYFHNLVVTETGGGQWEIAKFRAWVDYLMEKQVFILTINDWWNSRFGIIRIPTPGYV